MRFGPDHLRPGVTAQGLLCPLAKGATAGVAESILAQLSVWEAAPSVNAHAFGEQASRLQALAAQLRR